MSSRLLIRYDSDDLSRWSWAPLDRENRPQGASSTGDLQTLAAAAKSRKLVLSIPGKSLLITQVNLPEGSGRGISSTIAYALEEHLAEDIDQLHFAKGERQSDGSIPVVVISKQLLAQLLLMLEGAGLYPLWAVAEPLLLPWSEDGLSVDINDDRAVVRTGLVSGFECSAQQLPALIGRLRHEREGTDWPTTQLWQGEQGSEAFSLLEPSCTELKTVQASNGWDHFTALGAKRPTIDLLQGFEDPNAEQSSGGKWWPAVVLGCLTIVLYLGTSGFQYYTINQQIDRLSENTESLFRASFPEVKRIQSPLDQARQKLANRKQSHNQGEDNLLNLLSALAKAKQKGDRLEFKNIEYRQRSLLVQLEGQSVAQIERFKQQLEANGTSADILSTVSKDDRIVARIKLKGGSV